jgi:hypothetical protein
VDNDSVVVDIRFPTWISVGIGVGAGFSLKERAYVRFVS